DRVSDTLVRDEGHPLWLLAGLPSRWLETGQKIELQQVASYFGPLSLEASASEAAVTARIELPSQNTHKAAWLVVRVPSGKRIRSVEIDGKPWQDFDAAEERIRLPMTPGAMQVVVRY